VVRFCGSLGLTLRCATFLSRPIPATDINPGAGGNAVVQYDQLNQETSQINKRDVKELPELTIKVITSDMFIGYGLFTLIYLFVSLFIENISLLEKLDLAVNRFIGFVGIIYFLCVVTSIIMSMAVVDDYQIRWEPLVQVLLWTIITQLLSVEKFRKRKLVRLIFGILLIVSFELFVIFVTSLHRDYSLGGLFSGLSTVDIAIGLSSKMTVLCILAIIYSWVTDKLKKLRTT